MKKIVVTGAAGALGSAYVRALAANGYRVEGVDLEDQTMKAYVRLLDSPFEISKPEDWIDIRIHGVDLSKYGKRINRILKSAYAVVVAAANPLPFQSNSSADNNHRIDMNTINAALDNGVEVIIYMSSLLRLEGLMQGDKSVTPRMSAPLRPYGRNKQKTVEQLAKLSQSYRDVVFVYNDHGWYPRETVGTPPLGMNDRGIQTWVAERETQQHILEQIKIKNNPHFKDSNFEGFIVASRNIPTKEATTAGHRRFILDLSQSKKLGIELRANVYRELPHYLNWRNIPVYMV